MLQHLLQYQVMYSCFNTCKCTSMNKRQVIKNGIDMQCIYKTGKGDRKTNIEGVD